MPLSAQNDSKHDSNDSILPHEGNFTELLSGTVIATNHADDTVIYGTNSTDEAIRYDANNVDKLRSGAVIATNLADDAVISENLTPSPKCHTPGPQ